MLQSLKIGTPQDRTAIINLQKAKHYNLACLEHFKVMHPRAETMDISTDNVGNHPNAWFRASMAFEESVNGSGGAPETAEEKTSPDAAMS